jgi:hypothetical protein
MAESLHLKGVSKVSRHIAHSLELQKLTSLPKYEPNNMPISNFSKHEAGAASCRAVERLTFGCHAKQMWLDQAITGESERSALDFAVACCKDVPACSIRASQLVSLYICTQLVASMCPPRRPSHKSLRIPKYSESETISKYLCFKCPPCLSYLFSCFCCLSQIVVIFPTVMILSYFVHCLPFQHNGPICHQEDEF